MKNLKSIFLAILIGFFALIPSVADSDDFCHLAFCSKIPIGGWDNATECLAAQGQKCVENHLYSFGCFVPMGAILCTHNPEETERVDECAYRCEEIGHGQAYCVRDPDPALTEIKIMPREAKMYVGHEQEFWAFAVPPEADRRVTWRVDNEAIGTIEEIGDYNYRMNFTARAPGIVTITATSVADPTITKDATVTVKRPPPTSITISPSQAEININKSQQFSVIIYPEYADQSVTWSVGDPAIGTIDANGLFRANAAGTVIVIATSEAPPYIAEIVTVTVKERDPDQNQVQPPVQDPDQNQVRPPAQEEEKRRRGVCEGPLVPCGPDRAPCELCHIFILFNNIIQFVLICLVPPVAVAMLVIGGFVLMFAGGAPQLKSKAMSILKSAVVGLFIIYGAWLFINTFLAIIGVMDWTGLRQWFQPAIDCPVGPLPEAPVIPEQQGVEI